MFCMPRLLRGRDISGIRRMNAAESEAYEKF